MNSSARMHGKERTRACCAISTHARWKPNKLLGDTPPFTLSQVAECGACAAKLTSVSLLCVEAPVLVYETLSLKVRAEFVGELVSYYDSHSL